MTGATADHASPFGSHPMSFVQIRNLWSKIDAPVDEAAPAFNAVLSLLCEQKVQSYLHKDRFVLTSSPSFVQDLLFTNIRGYAYAVVDEGRCNQIECTEVQDKMILTSSALSRPWPNLELSSCAVCSAENFTSLAMAVPPLPASDLCMHGLFLSMMPRIMQTIRRKSYCGQNDR